jgi:hypothetical protein
MITATGYFCVAIRPVQPFGQPDVEFEAVVEFRNAYGELGAAQIAKLAFYGGLTLVYAVVGIFWGFLYVQNRHDILPVQNYITAIIGFLVLEMLLTWGYYDFENVHGSTIGAKAFLIVVAILNAARNSFSLFLLLIVCMGYGVVKPSLGKTMLYVRGLAALHFVFCVIYTIASMVIHPEDAGILVLFIILPLSATLTAFYVWTLNSLGATMKDLVDRKQHVKAGMYRKLWWCILTTIVVIFGFFFLNSFSFFSASNEDFAPTHWQTRWFILDGWLNLVYLADVIFIAYLWRPTPNNRRFAMSDEVSNQHSKQTYANIISLHKMTKDSRLTVFEIRLTTRILKIMQRSSTLLPVLPAVQPLPERLPCLCQHINTTDPSRLFQRPSLSDLYQRRQWKAKHSLLLGMKTDGATTTKKSEMD